MPTLNEQALEAATDMLRENTLVGPDPFTRAYWKDITREVLQAYFAATKSALAATEAAMLNRHDDPSEIKSAEKE